MDTQESPKAQTNKFSQMVTYNGELLPIEKVIELRQKEAQEMQGKTPEEAKVILNTKTSEDLDPEETVDLTHADLSEEEEKTLIRKTLKEKGIKFFPGACLTSLKNVCKVNGIIY